MGDDGRGQRTFGAQLSFVGGHASVSDSHGRLGRDPLPAGVRCPHRHRQRNGARSAPSVRPRATAGVREVRASGGLRRAVRRDRGCAHHLRAGRAHSDRVGRVFRRFLQADWEAELGSVLDAIDIVPSPHGSFDAAIVASDDGTFLRPGAARSVIFISAPSDQSQVTAGEALNRLRESTDARRGCGGSLSMRSHRSRRSPSASMALTTDDSPGPSGTPTVCARASAPPIGGTLWCPWTSTHPGGRGSSPQRGA